MSNSGSMRMLVVLVLFLALLTVASIILSVVAMTSWNKGDRYGGYDKGQGHGSGGYYGGYPPYPHPPPKDDKDVVVNNNFHDGAYGAGGSPGYGPGPVKGGPTYVIGFGPTWGTFERLSSKGAMDGWGKAVVEAACEAAGINCRTVIIPYSQCIKTVDPYTDHIQIGEGIGHHVVHACGGWFPTQERKNIAMFSLPFLTQPKIHLLHLGAAPIGALSTLSIGFVRGPPPDELCIGRYATKIGATIPDGNIQDFDSDYDGISALENGVIDLLFTSMRDAELSQHPEFPNLSIYDSDGNGDASDSDLNNSMYCSLGDAGLVARKDADDFIGAFNEGLFKIYGNGKYKDICWDDEYMPFSPTSAHTTWCVPYYTD